MSTPVYMYLERARAHVVAAIRIGFQVIAAAFVVVGMCIYAVVDLLDD